MRTNVTRSIRQTIGKCVIYDTLDKTEYRKDVVIDGHVDDKTVTRYARRILTLPEGHILLYTASARHVIKVYTMPRDQYISMATLIDTYEVAAD